MGDDEKLPGDGLLIERVEQVLRREGDRWEVITIDQVLQDFLIESGDYTFVAPAAGLAPHGRGRQRDRLGGRWKHGRSPPSARQTARVPLRDDVLMSVIKHLTAQRRKP